MEVRCPQCHSPIELEEEAELSAIVCSVCGSRFSLLGEETVIVEAAAAKTVGRFELTELLGTGAFASVWKARDTELDRTVAVKIPRKGQLAPEEAEQFLREARAAAQLQHPNIVSVHEVGREEDTVYIVSDVVQGLTLADWLTGKRVTSREAADLCGKMARALDHAHEAGVIHRDLKPANVMLDEDGEPHIMDFGLARRETGEVTMTMEGKVLGTPAYMSPEQARGEAHQADRRTDVYSLGVILFELLTGEKPFRGNVRMLLHQLINEEAPSPRKLESGIPRDLETICLKCLEKDADKRFGSAQELAEELERFVRAEPIESRPISSTARVWRWCRRKPVVAGLTATAALLLVAVAVVGMVGYVQTTRALGIAEERESQARSAQHTAEKAREAETVQRRKAEDARKLADKAREAEAVQRREADKAREAETKQRLTAETRLADMHTSFGLVAGERGDPQEAALWFASAAALASHDPEREFANRVRFGAWSRRSPMCLRALRAGKWIHEMTFHASSQYLMLVQRGSSCKIWDLENNRPVQLPNDLKQISAGAWDPKGDRLAVGTRGGDVAILTFPQGASLQRFSQKGVIEQLKFSPCGRYLAVVRGKAVRVWDCETGEYATPELAHPQKLGAVSFNTAGTRLATTCHDHLTRVFAVAGGEGSAEPLFKPLGCTKALWGVVQVPLFIHGDRILVAHDGWGRIGWWDAETGVLVRPLDLHGHKAAARFAVTPDGSSLLIYGDLRAFELRGIPSGERIGAFGEQRERGPEHSDAAFSSDGQVLVTVSREEHMARFWSVPARRQIGSVPCPGKCGLVAISPDGRLLAVSVRDGGRGLVCVWGVPDMPDDHDVHPLGYNRDSIRVAMSPDGRYIAPSGRWRHRMLWTTRVYEVATGRPAGPWMDIDGGLNGSAFSPDGIHLAALCSRPENRRKANPWYPGHLDPGRIRFWDWRTGTQVHAVLETPSEPAYGAYRHDGSLLVVLCTGGEVLLIDPATGQVKMQLDQGEKQPLGDWTMLGGVWFTSDGKRFATGGLDKIVRVWESSTGRLCHTFGPKGRVESVALSKDDQFLAIGRTGVRILDLATGKGMGAWLPHPNAVRCVEFSPDGRHLLTACLDGMVRVWDWRARRLACSALEHEGRAHCARFANDGRWILTTGDGACMRVWEWQTGKQVTPPKLLPGGRGCMILISPNGEYAAISGRDFSIATFDLRDLAQPPHHQLNLSELRTLSEIISTRRVEGSGTTRMMLDEWLQRWQSFRTARATHNSLSDFTATISDFAKEVRLAQREDETFREQADAFYKAREYEKAAAAYSHAIDLRPDDVKALWSRGKVFLYRLDRIEEAIADFTRAIQLDPDHGYAYQCRGNAFCFTGQLEKALADASRSIRSSSESPDVASTLASRHRDRASVLALLGRWEEVVEDFAEYVTRARHSHSIWSDHALLRLHVAGVDEYRRVCSELMKRFGKAKEVSLANNLAWSCVLGPKAVPDLTQCVALAEGVVAAYPERSSVRNTLGAILYRKGDLAGAIKHLNKCIELRGKGGSAEDWLFLAMSHHRLNHGDEARRWFEKATQWIGEHIGWDGAKKVSRAKFYWDSRLQLTLFHKEAESLLSASGPEGQKDAYGAVKDPARLKAVIKTLDDALETSFRKASSGKE